MALENELTGIYIDILKSLKSIEKLLDNQLYQPVEITDKMILDSVLKHFSDDVLEDLRILVKNDIITKLQGKSNPPIMIAGEINKRLKYKYREN